MDLLDILIFAEIQVRTTFLGTLSLTVPIAYVSSSKVVGKVYLQPIMNKSSPWGHMDFEFDMLGVVGKLMKYVVHSSKQFFYFILKYFSSQWVPKQQVTNYCLSQGILGLKKEP
jgi:hypothetical protein